MAPPLTPSNLVPDGGTLLHTTFATTSTIVTAKILDNSKLHRENTTLYCLASQAGSWHIYDVDESGTQAEMPSSPVAVTANTLARFIPPGITDRVWCSFTPSASSGSDTIVIRGFCAGFGVRG